MSRKVRTWSSVFFVFFVREFVVSFFYSSSLLIFTHISSPFLLLFPSLPSLLFSFLSFRPLLFISFLFYGINSYNAIHDPTIGMVSTATMIEGSLDVLSCSTLMALAAADLPMSVNGAIVIFSLLELVNACQSFALQALLSGGHDDTPLDLVKWKG